MINAHFDVAVTGFFSAVIGELLTGKGALGQLQLETRLPQNVINWGVFAIVVSVHGISFSGILTLSSNALAELRP